MNEETETHTHNTNDVRRVDAGTDSSGRHYVKYAAYCSECGCRTSSEWTVYE